MGCGDRRNKRYKEKKIEQRMRNRLENTHTHRERNDRKRQALERKTNWKRKMYKHKEK